MNAKAEVQNGGIDSLKWAVAVGVLAVGFFGYHHFKQYDLIYRVLGLLPLAALSVFVAFRTEKGLAFARLLRESAQEAKRVVWPTKQETMQTTGVVFAVVFVMSMVLWLLDVVFGKLVALLIG